VARFGLTTVVAHEGVPHGRTRRRRVLFDDEEQRAVPARHAVGLLVAEQQVLKVVRVVAAVDGRVGQQARVVLATAGLWGSYVQLHDCQPLRRARDGGRGY
jgi:hypothetical protein